jgi:hypothetical protein
MMDAEILGMLDNIGRSATARLTPEVYLEGETAQARRQKVLNTIRGTILPRRLEFSVSTGDILALEVNSSRVTDVLRCSLGAVPDFETGDRDEITKTLARLVSDIAEVQGPIEFASKRPDGTAEADDVGITYTEVVSACAGIELQEKPDPAPATNTAVQAVPTPKAEPEAQIGIAPTFYEDAAGFAQGRLLFKPQGEALSMGDGICATDQLAHPDEGVLGQFARDLAGWDADTTPCLTQPQLVVLRPSGGQGTGVALLRDGEETAAVVHDARKLGAVVNLWKTLTAPLKDRDPAQ